jgi:membrane protein DedA with SNARE-associated domain
VAVSDSSEPEACVRRAREGFRRHGARSLVLAKFVPGLGTAAPPLAGIVGMPLGRFLAWTGLGGLLWVGVFVGLGWALGDRLEHVTPPVPGLGEWRVEAGSAIAPNPAVPPAPG